MPGHRGRRAGHRLAGDPVQAAISLCNDGLARSTHRPRSSTAHAGTRPARASRRRGGGARSSARCARRRRCRHALQPRRRAADAAPLRATPRAPTGARSRSRPDLVAADFNLGVLFQEQGATDAAVAAYEAVLKADPATSRRTRISVKCCSRAGRYRRVARELPPLRDALPECAAARGAGARSLSVSGDFAGSTLSRRAWRAIASWRATTSSCVDCLEELLYLLLYFDVAPETLLPLRANLRRGARRLWRAAAAARDAQDRAGCASAISRRTCAIT